MPAIAFGLKSGAASKKPGSNALKRKAAFGEAEDQVGDEHDAEKQDLGKEKKPQYFNKKFRDSQSILGRGPRTKEAEDPIDQTTSRFKNLSALHSAKLQDQQAAELDSSVYDYDGVYDSFNAAANNKVKQNTDPAVPKYMSNLLASAETRKRDQLRAKEKQLQKEREAEGDEFADKEKFVTTAYKKQQEENRQLEDAERKREEEEENRRRQGGGMTGFHKDLLRKDEERQKMVEEAQAARACVTTDDSLINQTGEEDVSENKLAAKLNAQGANILLNEDGEIVDKRQLLTAGLNVAPKASNSTLSTKSSSVNQRPPQLRSDRPSDARLSQRERQSRMIERQIEEAESKQKAEEAAEQQKLETSAKSKLTDSDKMGAKERYLARKREREALVASTKNKAAG